MSHTGYFVTLIEVAHVEVYVVVSVFPSDVPLYQRKAQSLNPWTSSVVCYSQAYFLTFLNITHFTGIETSLLIRIALP